jgi:hypothetical protein
MSLGLRQIGLGCALAAIAVVSVCAQSNSYQRIFPQSKAAIDEALKNMQPNLSGRLPVLEGFAQAGQYSLDHYQRGYFQATVKVIPIPQGGSLVRVNVKVTAWYKDPEAYRSGYQLMTSNGRLEGDLMDQLADLLGGVPGAAVASSSNTDAGNREASSATSAADPAVEPADSAPSAASSSQTSDSHPSEMAGSNQMPEPQLDEPKTPSTTAQPASPSPSETTNLAPTAPNPKSPDTNQTFSNQTFSNQTFSTSMNHDLGGNLARPGSSGPDMAGSGKAGSGSTATAAPPVPKTSAAIQTEIDGLEEILKNQSHPKNLVAVKKSGTPVVDSPSLNGKTLFLASVHDEFEMLSFNGDWVHVRISGLSRGWIWRNSVEMPEGIPDTEAAPANAQATASDLFHIVREETTQFPGDWAPLRGKNVKLITVEKIGDNPKDAGPKERLAFVKFLFEKNYAELSQKSAQLSGIVVIFDSADGGMIGATLGTLQQWRAGTLSDSALWHKTFFDPPEIVDSSGSSASQ